MNFLEALKNAIEKNNSLLCVGLDTDMSKIPAHLRNSDNAILAFNRTIIDATNDLVCCYKPNSAFYTSLGEFGLASLKQTTDYIHKAYPDIPVILDAKRGDIGSTSEKYAEEVFNDLQADAVTVQPYQGFDGIEPFLKYRNKGVFVLCRTSNPSARDFQDLMVDNKPLYLHVAEKIKVWREQYENCMVVVGSTWPDEMRKIRAILPDTFFLVPGIGSQGGYLEKTLQNGLTADNSGLLINSSRGIIYASNGHDFADAARQKAEALRNKINSFR